MVTEAIQRKGTWLGWLGLCLTALYVLLAWMAWSDIAVNLYQYNNPDAVKDRHWVGLLFPAASAAVTLFAALLRFRSRQSWQGWTIWLLFLANVILQILLIAIFLDSLQGLNFG
jgi:phosphatidylserine synthase